MKFKIIAIMVVLVLTTFGVAWADEVPPPVGEESTGCYSTHTSGSGVALLQWCASNHGNLYIMQSPAGNYTIYPGYEGYSLCTGGTTTTTYFDTGYYESSWINLSIYQPNGANTLPLTITRTTADGKFQLTQKYAQSTTGKSVTITMTVKNISGVSQPNVYVTRHALLGNGINYYDKTPNGTFGRVTYGVVQNAETYSASLPVYSTAVNYWSAIMVSGGCTPVSDAAPGGPAYEAGSITYKLGTIGNNASKTVKFTYKRI